jgi:beta-phosphoglucomutase
MIKAILFDMDGVLIEARDWHYDALNDALRLFGCEISRDQHLAEYDGLPTRTKLERLTSIGRLPAALHDLVNARKQRRTLELIQERCRPVFQHQYALRRLREDGYRLGVCSNSVRQTVEMMTDQAGLAPYLELRLSNDDVARPKPDPEIYTSAMKMLGVAPGECLVVEDNDHGLQAARASGAHVLAVGSPADVRYERIVQAVRELG